MTLTSKKAQMHMTETIGVLFIFFILVAFGLIFYYKYTEQAMKEEHRQAIADRAVKTALEVFTLPELACTRGDAELEDYCVDMAKVRHLNETFNNDYNFKDYYFKLFGYAKIKVVQLYPSDGQNYTLYDKKRPTNETSEYEASYFVIALKDEITDLERTPYSFGYVEVGVYATSLED